MTWVEAFLITLVLIGFFSAFVAVPKIIRWLE